MPLLEDLSKMSPEDGVAMMKQLFNPLRGRAVGYIGENRRSAGNALVEEAQNKVQEKSVRGVTGSLDTIPEGTSVHFGTQAFRRGSQPPTSPRNKRT